MRAVFGSVLASSLFVSPAFAQSSSSTWNGLSDRFQIDSGYFRILVSPPGGEVTYKGFQVFLTFLF